jgi:hypothetical protein
MKQNREQRDATADVEPPRGRGLRAHDRYEWNERCEVSWLVDGEPGAPELLECVDLGLGGISVISEAPRLVGEVGAVLLLGDGRQSGCIRALEVVHCRFDPSLRRHIVGGRWISELPCLNRLFVQCTKLGQQLVVRPSGRTDSSDRDVA